MLVAQECAAEILSSPMCQFIEPDHRSVIEFQLQMRVQQATVNFVCRDNVDSTSFGFNLYPLLFSSSFICPEYNSDNE